MSIEQARSLAVREAINYILDAEVVGIGTGSTIDKFIKLLSDLRGSLSSKYFIASSLNTSLKLRELGLKVLDFRSIDSVDVYVDSADKVDTNLNLIKGGGAALTLEKILTYYSKLNVFVVDYSKLVNDLHNEFIPVDVLPQALTLLTRYLGRLGYEFSIRYSGKGRYGPVLSDVGGVIIDVKLPPNEDLVGFEKSIKSLPGVIEVGLFIGLTDVLIIGYEDRVERLRGRRLYSVYSSSRTA